MPFRKLALTWAALSLLLMTGCAGSPDRSPSVHVAQTQVQVPAPPAALLEVSRSLPDFVRWMEEICSSSMARLGLSSPDTAPQPISPGKP